MEGDLPLRAIGHQISPSAIDVDAHKVLRRLNQFGHQAYLVGGGVRDLLLGRSPKDFDVATSASPNEVRKLFRNCRLIGRRFRLAHILFTGGKIIEVATFRARPLDAGDDLLITDDNEFGDPRSDAFRRDFTVNGLFYDSGTGEVIDYCRGLEDLEARLMRAIGPPRIRFREDPIRMLRAVKFAARLSFDIEAETRQALIDERLELAKAAVPRLFEELLRMLYGGAAGQSFELLAELGLLDLLLPELAAAAFRPGGEACAKQLKALLGSLSLRCVGQPTVDNGVLLACLYWPMLTALMAEFEGLTTPTRGMVEALVGPMAVRMRMPRRDANMLITVLEGQFRFEAVRRRPSARAAFARGGQFPSIFDFFEIRAEAEHLEESLVKDWRSLASEFPPQSYAERKLARRRRPTNGGGPRRGRRRG